MGSVFYLAEICTCAARGFADGFGTMIQEFLLRVDEMAGWGCGIAHLVYMVVTPVL